MTSGGDRIADCDDLDLGTRRPSRYMAFGCDRAEPDYRTAPFHLGYAATIG